MKYQPTLKLILLIAMLVATSAYAQSVFTYKIEDTGQDSCYDNLSPIIAPAPGSTFFGQDAQFNGNQPSFTDNEDGTITDNVTGLMWSKDLDMNGGDADYIAFGKALGWMQDQTGTYQLLDVHGAGAQRSDPKTGDPANYLYGHGPQEDVIRIYNYVRLVRGAGLATSVGSTNGSPVPASPELNQNYPNPFNPSTAISYRLSAASQVTLEVYDILGRKVKTLTLTLQANDLLATGRLMRREVKTRQGFVVPEFTRIAAGLRHARSVPATDHRDNNPPGSPLFSGGGD